MKDASIPGQFCQSRMGKMRGPCRLRLPVAFPTALPALLSPALPCWEWQEGEPGPAPGRGGQYLTPSEAGKLPWLKSLRPWLPAQHFFSGSWIALQRPSKAPTFPLSKQMGLSGISSLRVELCAFTGTCGFPQTEAPLLCLPFSGRRS